MKSNNRTRNARSRNITCLSCGDPATLACGKCEDPLCGKCVLHTPGGIRCRTCAQLKKPVQYQIPKRRLAITIMATLPTALLLGSISIVPTTLIGQIPLLNLVGHGLIAYALGLLISKLMKTMSGNKLGRNLQIIGLISGLLVLSGRSLIFFALTGGVILSLFEFIMAGVISLVTWRRFE
jgi:hypothetical protein